MYKDYRKFSIFDIALIVVGFIGVSMVIFAVGSIPKSYEANKICNENGYTQYDWYLDGTIYCGRKGELGKDEIVRIK